MSCVIIPLCKKVHLSHHAKGRIHADIKPSNILLMSDGPWLIDNRGCSVGGISSNYTPGWCAPEQTLGKPLSAAADVYSLAMLVLTVLRAQIFGEIKYFQTPSPKPEEAPPTIKVLDTDGVWMNKSSGLSEQSRQAWRTALSSFLSFNPSNRPANGEELGEALMKLLQDHPLLGAKPHKFAGPKDHRWSHFSLSIFDPIAAKKEASAQQMKKGGASDPLSPENPQPVDASHLADPHVSVLLRTHPVWVFEDTYPTVK